MNPSNSLKTVGLFVGRIPKSARVKDLKDALADRPVHVVSLTWKGMKGFAFIDVEIAEGESEASVLAKLDGLKICESSLNVELDRRHQNGHKKSGDGRDSNGDHDLVNNGSDHNAGDTDASERPAAESSAVETSSDVNGVASPPPASSSPVLNEE